MIKTRFNDSSLTSVRHRRILIGSRESRHRHKAPRLHNRRPSLAITGPVLDYRDRYINGVGV